jgi:thiol-disulfide isomerase/thioredoxin
MHLNIFVKRVLLLAVILGSWTGKSVLAGNPTNELIALVSQVNSDIHSGKKTEADLSSDINQFNAILAEHKGEKTDIMAQTLLMEATLYAQVIGDTKKADTLINQLKTDYSGTKIAMAIEKDEAREAAEAKMRASLVPGIQFPDFNEEDVSGKPLSLANYHGKVVLVDFWATWCMPCRMELPNVIAAYQKYHNKGFEVVGISLDTTQKNLLDFTTENNMPWPQYFDGHGWDNKLVQKYGIEAIPATFLLDGNGKIIGENLRGEELDDAVAKAIAAN